MDLPPHLGGTRLALPFTKDAYPTRGDVARVYSVTPNKFVGELTHYHRDVRYWHKADIQRLRSNVRCWGQSGH